MSTNNVNLSAEQRAELAVFGVPQVEDQTTVKRQAELVEIGAREIIKSEPRNMQRALIRALNKEHGSPFDKDDLRTLHKSLDTLIKECDREGCKPLIGIESIMGAVKKADKGSGYLVKYIIPKASFTLIGGAPKVGKTSIAVAMLIRALIGEEGVTGLRSKAFSHLTIYSDDQSPADTARYITGSLQGLDDPSAAIEKLKGLDLNIYPNLVLDEDGADRLTQQAAAKPGGVFLIDSLTSTGSKLGYDENSSDVSRIIYDLRESIQSVDPTATVLLIHHQKKGGSNSNSQVDSFRGSSAITGAVDNILTVERPTAPKGGAPISMDMTGDRIIHLVGRTIGETKIVVRSDFSYETRFDEETEDELYSLKSISMDYLCDYKDYETLGEESSVVTKAHTDWLTDSQISVIKFLGSKRKPQQQKYIPGVKGTTSTAIKVLLDQTPPLIIKELDESGKEVFSVIPELSKTWSKVIPDPNPSDF